MRVATGFGVVLALACGVPSVAMAQEKQPAPRHRHCPGCGQELPSERCPTCHQGKPVADEDRELDRALRREYGDPNGPAPRRLETPEPTPIPPPPVDPNRRAPSYDDEDRDFYVRLGVFGAHWAARVTGVSVSNARNGFHGDYVSLSGGKNAAGNLEGWSQTQLFKAWIDLGPWFSFDGGANRSFFTDTGQLNRDFVFRGQQFTTGSALQTRFQSLVADFNFVVHPVHGRFGHLDVLFGFRYLYSKVTFQSNGGNGLGPAPQPPVIVFVNPGFGFSPFFLPQGPGPAPFAQASSRTSQTSEAVIPMIGIGGTLRPVHTKDVSVEIFARARAGGFEWQERGYSYRRNKWIDRGFYAYSSELDGGISLVLFQTLGLTAGYRMDVAFIERNDMRETNRSEWKAHGPYAGAFLQF